MRIRHGLCVILVLSALPSLGRDIFVDNRAGDDRSTGQQARGTSETGPVRTLGRALCLAQNGDAITMANTGLVYHESISLVGSRLSGSPQRPFVLRGNGAFLDGSAPIPPEAWRPYEGGVFRFRPRLMSYQQLFINDLPASRVIATGASHRPPKLRPREWCLLDGQIYFCVEPGKLPRDYRLTCAAGRTGITLFHVENVVIADLTVQGFQLDGISAFNSVRGVSLVNVTCRGNGRSGVTVGGASAATIANSLLANNGTAQLLTLPYSETRLAATHLLSNSAPGWVEQGGRVFLNGKRIEGGLDEFRPTALP
ncbi:MAG: right-handed parallel beta-helix repeat-containing protein, partial [Thermoguttaceae bacterium]